MNRVSLLDSKFYETMGEMILLLRRRGLTLGIAESCSGGLFSSELARFPGVSDIFAGGVVTYSNETKTRLLQVPMSLIEKHGAVSTQVVSAMAMGALTMLDADWSVAITGIAGPTGGSEEKPVGHVWFAVGHKDQLKTVSHNFAGERRDVQEKAVLFALDLLVRELR